MGWDRSQRPRNPRLRASKRNIADLGEGWRAFALPDSCLSAADVASIIATIPSAKVTEHLRYFLPIIDRRYNHSKLEPTPARSESRYQLRMIAHLAWKLEQVPCDIRAVLRQMACSARSVNQDVVSLLKPHVFERSDGTFNPMFSIYFGGAIVDPLSFGEAAMEAERQLPGAGDYGNEGLSEAVALLFFMYDVATNSWPTFSLASIGPCVAAGSQRQIVGSECGRFLLAFFDKVDPGLSPTQVTNAFRAQLVRNRASERRGMPYYRNLVRA